MTFPLLLPIALKKYRRVRQKVEDSFTYLIDEVFEPELKELERLGNKNPQERDKGEKRLFQKFKDKYSDGCPTNFYSMVREDLREKYDMLHSSAVENL